MLRLVIVALVTLEIVLLSALTLSPANATSSSGELGNYIWGFADIGSTEIVCKQITIHPEKQVRSRSSDREVIQMDSSSIVVSDRFCAGLTKPQLASK